MKPSRYELCMPALSYGPGSQMTENTLSAGIRRACPTLESLDDQQLFQIKSGVYVKFPPGKEFIC